MYKYLELKCKINLTFLFWIATLSSSCIQGVKCIMCVQCSTLVESSEEVCKSGDIPAYNCSNSNDTACIKYKGTHNGIEFVFRGCDNKKISEVCENRVIEGEIVPTCYYRCFTDGCNGVAPSFHPSSFCYSLLPLFSYLLSDYFVK